MDVVKGAVVVGELKGSKKKKWWKRRHLERRGIIVGPGTYPCSLRQNLVGVRLGLLVCFVLKW